MMPSQLGAQQAGANALILPRRGTPVTQHRQKFLSDNEKAQLFKAGAAACFCLPVDIKFHTFNGKLGPDNYPAGFLKNTFNIPAGRYIGGMNHKMPIIKGEGGILLSGAVCLVKGSPIYGWIRKSDEDDGAVFGTWELTPYGKLNGSLGSSATASSTYSLMSVILTALGALVTGTGIGILLGRKDK